MAKQQNDDLFDDEKIDYIEERNKKLRDIPYDMVRKAWFMLSHLLLQDDSIVVDMGCNDGMLTYAMAALCPNLHFIGVDKSNKIIKEASKTYQLDNLEFKVGDASSEMFEPESVDAIMNSYILHQVFSNARYNERMIADTLRKQFTMLKEGGMMFIRDYAKPDGDEFVLLEMHDEETGSEDIMEMSEAELLVWYSEHARPKQDPGCGGFFLEELEPRFPRTRLFRLPYKWAYEFIMRKDKREIWERSLPFEYTFFTVKEFRQTLSTLGARVQYSTPHWDEEYIEEHFAGNFRLLKTNGDPLGDPPTSFIAVAQKQPERSSLNVLERRVSRDEDGELEIKTLSDTKTGELLDVVTRQKELAEILPFRIDENGRLYIYLHEGVVRGVANSVIRSGINIDGREWSGHMLEAISTDYDDILSMEGFTPENTDEFAQSFIGIDVEEDSVIEQGPSYYPDPNYIDERVHTFYIEVAEEKKKVIPKRKLKQDYRFQSKGIIREFYAQNILDAITVGMIPNSRLELQILSLMQKHNVRAENWIKKEIDIHAQKITDGFKLKDFLGKATNNEKRFKEAKDTAGELRTVNSVFVEEGQSQGGYTGLSSENIDFVISEKRTVNTAVVVPIAKSLKGDLHAGFNTKHMPVPQRYEGKSLSISAPQFNIPKDITNLKMMKQFIAEKFGVTPDKVVKLGESYYSHVGITPQRIYPFAVVSPPKTGKSEIRYIPFYQYMLLWKSLSKEQHFMTVIARAYRYIPSHMKMQARKDIKIILEGIFKSAQPDWSLPTAINPTKQKQDVKRSDEDESSSGKAEDPEKPKLEETPISVLNNRKKEIEERQERKKGKKSDTVELRATKTSDVEHAIDTDGLKAEKPKAIDVTHPDISLIEDFEQEIDDLFDAMEQDNTEEHKPEKW